eukprot:5166923-Heterocapsa_arctica.AAC.1
MSQAKSGVSCPHARSLAFAALRNVPRTSSTWSLRSRGACWSQSRRTMEPWTMSMISKDPLLAGVVRWNRTAWSRYPQASAMQAVCM